MKMVESSLPFPNLNPVAIQLGPLAIRWYALAYIAGILFGWRYCVAIIHNPRLWGGRQPPATPNQIDDLILWITLGIILGGRIGYVLFYGRGMFSSDPLEVLRIWRGGMSFHGGFIGVCVAITVFAYKNRISLLALGDLVAPCAPVGLLFVRLANFVNGELWGRPTALPWGVVFPNAPDGLPRHPSQLYEAGLEGLMLFLVLRLATHRFHSLPRAGVNTGLFLLGYGLARILLENVRQPDAGLDHLPLGLTMGMMLSAPMALAGVWLLWRAWRREWLVAGLQAK